MVWFIFIVFGRKGLLGFISLILAFRLFAFLSFLDLESGSQPVGRVTLLGVKSPFLKGISDIYNSSKITVWRRNENKFYVCGSPQHEELYYRVTALGRLRTLVRSLIPTWQALFH